MVEDGIKLLFKDVLIIDELARKLIDIQLKAMMTFLNNVLIEYDKGGYDVNSPATTNALRACEILLKIYNYIGQGDNGTKQDI